MGHTATLLNDGRVLVIGGHGVHGIRATAELFDPSTGIWSPAGRMARPRARHTTTLLDNGRVLVVGGVMSGNATVTEIYDPSMGSWTSSGP